MDIGQGISKDTYVAAVRNIHTAVSAVFNVLSQKAIEEEKEKKWSEWKAFIKFENVR